MDSFGSKASLGLLWQQGKPWIPLAARQALDSFGSKASLGLLWQQGKPWTPLAARQALDSFGSKAVLSLLSWTPRVPLIYFLRFSNY
jgi:hypothetical protein